MRFNKLDLNLLVALDVLLSTQNVSRAAEQMALSQSAMSNALARLREYFQDELLVQVGRRMELTPRAETLREAVRDVLLRVGTTITAQPEFKPSQAEREFTLFVSDYTMQILLPEVLKTAAKLAPNVSFRFLPQVDQPQRSLEQGEVDLLIIPETFASAEHPTSVLYEEEFVCLVWSRGRFARRPITLEDYLETGHVVMQPGTSSRSYESTMLKAQGVERRVEVMTYSFMALPYLVVGTQRIATVHRRLAEQACRHLPLKYWPSPVKAKPMRQCLQWHKYRAQDPGLSWLRELIMQTAEQT